VVMMGIGQGTRAGLAPWHSVTYLRNDAMGPSWSSDGRLSNANT
jgi:hypothetical protein